MAWLLDSVQRHNYLFQQPWWIIYPQFSHKQFLCFLDNNKQKIVQLMRYSSETRIWDSIVAMPSIEVACVRASSLASHRGCFILGNDIWNIIAFDNTTKALYYLQCPQETHDDILNHRLHTISNVGVGLAVLRGFTLWTWCSVRSSAIDHVWIPEREVNLSNLLILDTSLSYDGRCKPKILCACEDRDILVVKVNNIVYQLNIKNYQWKNIYGDLDSCTIYPFTMVPG
jgi:hypothetical protein